MNAIPPVEWLELNAGVGVTKTFSVRDEPDLYRVAARYALIDGRVFEKEIYRFDKINPFAADRGRITVDYLDGTGIHERAESELVKTTGTIDNESEFHAWVECRLPGTDQVVHRSASTYLKRGLTAAGAAGGFG